MNAIRKAPDHVLAELPKRARILTNWSGLFATIFPLFVFIALFVIGPACSRVETCRECNVILISIDTLRPDHLDCYGYHRETSPNVVALAKDGVLFTTAIAQAPSTLASHASMLTSLIPNHHGAWFGQRYRLPDSIQTFAQILSSNGFATRSWNGGGQLAHSYGLARGFDHYEFVRQEDFHTIVGKAIEWIESFSGEKFFLFLHTYQTHLPFRPRKELMDRLDFSYSGGLPDTIEYSLLKKANRGEITINEADLSHILNAYDAEIISMDEALGKLLGFLREKGLYDDTIIVFTSDHGEEFNDHGKIGQHSHAVHDELIKIPLVIKLPESAFASRTIETQVRSIDIMPTLLELLSIMVPDDLDGVSLMRLIVSRSLEAQNVSGTDNDMFAVSERDEGTHGRHLSSIRTQDWKLHVRRKGDSVSALSLYDLNHDPGERSDRSKTQKSISDSLLARMEAVLRRREAPTLVKASTDDKTQERLKALGYLD